MKPLNRVIDHLRRVSRPASDRDIADSHLLDRFVESREETAFELLVRRHGPMVLGVCRRLLGNAHDAEDAFQATFLILARKAASIVPRSMVGNWLHGVAYRTALEARSNRARRFTREKQLSETLRRETEHEDPWLELRPILDQELNRLPEKYRVLLVLCDLEGRSQTEVAKQLGCPTGTVSGRLTRARRLLAKALTRHGITLSAGSLQMVLAQNAASACVPAALLTNTLNAAAVVAAGQLAPAALVSAQVSALTEGVMNTMWTTKLKIVTAVCLAIGISTGGAGVAYHKASAEPVPGIAAAPVVPSPETPKAAPPDLQRQLIEELKTLIAEQEKKTQAEQERLRMKQIIEQLDKAIKEQEEKQKAQKLLKMLTEALEKNENATPPAAKEETRKELEALVKALEKRAK